METQFFYDLADKKLSFRLKERVTSKPDLELKARGLFNLEAGTLAYRGTVKKYLSLGGQDVKGAGTTPVRIGGGDGMEVGTHGGALGRRTGATGGIDAAAGVRGTKL